MYGENCGIACGNCLAKEQCHHINGTCMNGCDRGYQGSKCTEGDHCYLMLKTLCFNSKCMTYYSVMMVFYLECDENFFGINCKEQCYTNCVGCNKKTGVCDTGCKPGWKGMSCQESKIYYGFIYTKLKMIYCTHIAING